MNTKQAATALGVTQGRVRQMLRAGVLRGAVNPTERGPVWVIDEASVRQVAATVRRPGRKGGEAANRDA